MKAHRARRDASEPEVIDALERCGELVFKLAQKGLPDLLTVNVHTKRISLVEVKTKKGKLRETQSGWEEDGLPVSILRSAEEVWQWARRA